jgi:hypothetical protein
MNVLASGRMEEFMAGVGYRRIVLNVRARCPGVSSFDKSGCCIDDIEAVLIFAYADVV